MKHQIIRAASNLGACADSLLSRPPRVGTHILMYHRVAERARSAPAPTINVPPDALERQLRGLLEMGYDIVPLGDVVEQHHSGKPTTNPQIVVTFDDGYENIYSQVYPIARRIGVPFTIFVCTKLLGTRTPMHFDQWGIEHQGKVAPESYLPLSWEQCEEMLDSGLVEIASHSHTHADFRGDIEGFAKDMQLDSHALATRLGIYKPNFAFPYGRVDEGFSTSEMMNVVRSLGIRSALTTEPIPIDTRTSPFGWGRYNVFSWDSATTIAARLNGCCRWLSGGRRRMRRLLGLAKDTPASCRPTADKRQVAGGKKETAKIDQLTKEVNS